VFLGLWRGVHPQSPLAGASSLLHKSIDAACVLEKRGTKSMHIFIKVGGGLRGERLSYLNMYLLQHFLKTFLARYPRSIACSIAFYPPLRNARMPWMGFTNHAARNHRSGLCFPRESWCIFFFGSPLVLRAPSTDRPETLPHGQNLAQFYNPFPKTRGEALPLPPQKNGDQQHAQFPSILDHFRLWSRISPERLTISKIGRR